MTGDKNAEPVTIYKLQENVANMLAKANTPPDM